MLRQNKCRNLICGKIVSGRKPYQLRCGLRLLQQHEVCILAKVLQDGQPLSALLLKNIPDQNPNFCIAT
ncbi:hypothetical protein D3C75_1280290 [compost metagenome]